MIGHNLLAFWNELRATLKSSERLSSLHKNMKTYFQNCNSILNPWRVPIFFGNPDMSMFLDYGALFGFVMIFLARLPSGFKRYRDLLLLILYVAAGYNILCVLSLIMLPLLINFLVIYY